MAGIRIQHPTARNGLFLVKHYRKYKFPIYCEECREFHSRKTYHLRLDGEGCTIVSTTVLERLKEVGLAGFSIRNEVKNPPPITLKIPGLIENKFKVYEVGAHGEERPV